MVSVEARELTWLTKNEIKTARTTVVDMMPDILTCLLYSLSMEKQKLGQQKQSTEGRSNSEREATKEHN